MPGILGIICLMSSTIPSSSLLDMSVGLGGKWNSSEILSGVKKTIGLPTWLTLVKILSALTVEYAYAYGSTSALCPGAVVILMVGCSEGGVACTTLIEASGLG